jgi:hypothetical protein
VKLAWQGGRPPRDHRRVLDAVFWIARTGARAGQARSAGSRWSTA